MLLEKRKLRVAAYCQVSIARDEQLVSLAAQKAHYESYIKSNDEWEFAGLYYDEGISDMKKRKARWVAGDGCRLRERND